MQQTDESGTTSGTRPALASKSTGTMTRADLCDALHHVVGLSRAESAGLVKMVFGYIGDTLVSGDAVKISSFGSFMLRDKVQRVGRNPKTGEEVPIAPRTVLTFRPSRILRERVNCSTVKT